MEICELYHPIRYCIAFTQNCTVGAYPPSIYLTLIPKQVDVRGTGGQLTERGPLKLTDLGFSL